jgi:carbonic anhydrase
MKDLTHLFANNRTWAARMRAADPDYFPKLARLQAPHYLWIGCSDSRVPANEITGLMPGEVFVHRNVANVVVQTDLNLLSVLQFAIDHLRIEHIILCGHYGCGGVSAVMAEQRVGLADNWLRQVEAVKSKHQGLIGAQPTDADRLDRLCELNVLEQVVNVARTTVVQDAWARGQALQLHGWVYGLHDGLLRDLDLTVEGSAQVLPRYRNALALLARDAQGQPSR